MSNSDLISQTQRAALHALIEAQLDGIKGRARNRRRNDLLHELPQVLGVERMKDIPSALYQPAVAWLNGETGQMTAEEWEEALKRGERDLKR